MSENCDTTISETGSIRAQQRDPHLALKIGVVVVLTALVSVGLGIGAGLKLGGC